MSVHNSTQDYLSVDEALNNAPLKPLPESSWKAFINCFAVFFIVVVLAWFLPESNFKSTALKFTEKPMQVLGWYQHWGLFSPLVRTNIYHETAIITFKDGSSKIYEYPRMDKMSLWEKFRREKLRKMFSDCMPWPGYNVLLPVFARHLAQSNNNPKNPPTSISYIFNWATNPDPVKERIVSRDNLPKHTNKEITFVYHISESDLNETLTINKIHTESGVNQ